MNRPCWWISLALIAFGLAVSVWLYPTLPEQVATHWNIRGEADGYGPKWMAAWALPVVALGLLGVMALLPWLSPKAYPIDASQWAYEFLVVVLTAMFVFIHLVALAGAVNHGFPVGRVLFAGIFLALAAIGTSLGKLKRNFFIGVRVPWTLASEQVWDETHRLAGKVFVVTGLLGCGLAALNQIVVASLLLIPMALVPIVYSFLRCKQLERQGRL